MDRPFSMVLEIPGSGNAFRIVNTATVEFLLTTRVETHTINNEFSNFDLVMGGDSNEGFIGGNRRC